MLTKNKSFFFISLVGGFLLLFASCAQSNNPTSTEDKLIQNFANNSTIYFLSGKYTDNKLDLYAMDFDGNNLMNLTNSDLNEKLFELSIDGRYIFLIANNQIGDDLYKMNIDGSNLTRLTNTASNKSFKRSLRVSPDGNYLFFNAADNGFSDVWDVYRIGTDGSGLQNLTNGSMGVAVVTDVEKNGFELLLEVSPGLFTGKSDIQLYNTLTRSSLSLSKNIGYNYCPLFSPDGQVVFSSWRENSNRYCLYAVNKDGSELKQLTTTNGIDLIDNFIEDGKRILFQREADQNSSSSICVMNSDGGNIFSLTQNIGNRNWSPELSADESKIVFVSDRDGDEEIYIMNNDGSGQKNLTNRPEFIDYIPKVR